MKLLKMKSLSLICTSTLICSGCATMSDSVILGIGTGAATGAVLGTQMRGESDKAGAGAAIGAALGGLGAYFIHKGLSNRDERTRRETLLNLEKYEVSLPGRSNQNLTKTQGDLECHAWSNR